LSVHSHFLTVVVIGFEREEYSVSEMNGVVTVGVLVLEGSLGTDLTLELSTINGSASCEFIEFCV